MSAASKAETLREELEARGQAVKRRAEHPNEEEIIRSMAASGIDLDTIEVVRFGLEVQEFISKQPVGRWLVDTVGQQLTESVRTMLDMDSLDDKTARDAHFRARVALGVLRLFNQAVVDGQEAEAAIRARDDAEVEPTGSE